MQRSGRIDVFCRLVWQWFRRHKRDLPWRDLKVKDQTQRAYMVLVSEVMLQQTQVPRVEVIFKRFLREFPTIHHLAKATNRQVILAWRGMGYNARALRLRDAARHIVEQFLVAGSRLSDEDSKRNPHKPETRNTSVPLSAGQQTSNTFPRTMEHLTAIPGIGPYTAAAILNFAFNIPTPCLDTNIRRILHRVFHGPEKRDGTWRKNDRALMGIAERLLSLHLQGVDRGGGEWHAALMDFGSLVCTKRAPQCDSCPLGKSGVCRSAGKVRLSLSAVSKKEPGREIAGRFVPNRIIRGRVVEYLRDHHGVTLRLIGANVCIDWNARKHRAWLTGILKKLESDGILRKTGGRYALTE